MYYNDHSPPHFHARYGGQEVVVAIDSFAILDGRLPPRVLGLVLEWASLHQAELRARWEQARSGRAVDPVPPLEL
jgi:hypothetical protein